jgi:hypothetical protein
MREARTRNLEIPGLVPAHHPGMTTLHWYFVIASEAKQSIEPQKKAWIASSLPLLAMTVRVSQPFFA